MNLDLELDLNI